jgi:ESS family glutamate:Na+ symporter
VLTDIGLVSALLVVAHLLRAAIPWLSRYFIPTSMIAGLLALLAGPGGYDLLPFSRNLNGDPNLSSYPGVLITLLFATLLMGNREGVSVRAALRSSGTSFLFSMGSEFMQYGVTLCLGVALISYVFIGLPPEFILMMPAGFAGGHGTAAAYADALPNWAPARSVGFTFATIGILAAVFGGLVLINIARRFGWVASVRAGDPAENADQATFVPTALQGSLGRATVNGIALESLAWHFALVFAVYGAAMAVLPKLRELLPPNFVLPAFAVAMLLGWLLQSLLNVVRVGQFVDAQVTNRIGSLMSDFLVAFGIASINIQIVIDYAVPLVLFSLLGLALSVAWLLIVAPRVYGKRWFEAGIFTYGWNVATIPFGVALLRIVDKRGDSTVLADYGVAYIAIGPLEALLYTTVLAALASGYLLPVGVALIVMAVAMVLIAVRRARHAAADPD